MVVEDVRVSKNFESVAGAVAANARLDFGFEQLHLVITDKRIIVVHGAKKGRAGLASAVVVGSHSGAFLDPDKPRKRILGTSFKGLDPEKILKSHKDNFSLDYSEVISVEVDDALKSTSIDIVTNLDKFQFFTDSSVRDVMALLEPHLGNRLVTRSKSW